MNDSVAAGGPSPSEVRRLAHEIKNQLYVVQMGLEVLQSVRTDPDEFVRMVTYICKDGLEPLKSTLSSLIELAERQQASADSQSSET